MNQSSDQVHRAVRTARTRSRARAGVVLALAGGIGVATSGAAFADTLVPVPSVPTLTVKVGSTAVKLAVPPVPSTRVVAGVSGSVRIGSHVSAPVAPHRVTGRVLPVKVRVSGPVVGRVLSVPKGPSTAHIGRPAPSAALRPLVRTSITTKRVLGGVGRTLSGTPFAPFGTSPMAAKLADVKADLSPLATLCLQLTGSGTALANLDLDVLRTDLGSPLVRTLPGVLAHCAANGAGSSTGTGGLGILPGIGGGIGGIGAAGNPLTGQADVANAAITLGDLARVCVRVPGSVLPVQLTAVLLDRDLTSTLEKTAPLTLLLVPCPTGTSTGTGGTGTGTGSGGSGNPVTGTGDIAGAVITVGDLARVCVKVPGSILPVQLTAVLLDRDLTSTLEKTAPLASLLVPCPAGTTNGGSGNGGSGNGGSGNGGSGNGGSGNGGSGNGGSGNGGSGGTGGGGNGGTAASGDFQADNAGLGSAGAGAQASGLDAVSDNAAVKADAGAHSLAFTGTETGILLALAALLASGGAAVTVQARRARAALRR